MTFHCITYYRQWVCDSLTHIDIYCGELGRRIKIRHPLTYTDMKELVDLHILVSVNVREQIQSIAERDGCATFSEATRGVLNLGLSEALKRGSR